MHFPIVKNTKIWFSFSGILSVLSLFVLFAPGFGLPLGIDFTGGTELSISFSDPLPTKEKIQEVFTATLSGERGAKVVQEADSPIFHIRSQEVTPEEQVTFLGALKNAGLSPKLESVSSVGPTLGEYFKKNAFRAIIVTLLVIILFVAWAFRKVPQGISSWNFGLAAVVALAHDVIIIAGFFAFVGIFLPIEIDSLFVTALLTVLGFSVHDTIVVFDRLRENLKGKNLKDFAEVAEEALWQTMGRSMNTSVSAILVLLAVILFGAESIFAFVLALAFGITFGTYSSIFIAVPLLVKWQEKAFLVTPKNS